MAYDGGCFMRSQIRAALKLDGFDAAAAQLKMAPLSRTLARPSTRPGRARVGAVLIVLFVKKGETYLLFIKRQADLKDHPGQISFPGGVFDPTDADLQETALRETWEEMGIRAEDIEVLGRTDNFLTNTHFLVTPYVGYFPHPYPYTINPDEIAHTIEVPLEVLLKPDIFEVRRWEREGVVWNIHYYH